MQNATKANWIRSNLCMQPLLNLYTQIQFYNKTGE